jgi:2-polyprenyl-3-methyl-5-hydroxy-6-metoxy-1,4-benzoquinol methylase
MPDGPPQSNVEIITRGASQRFSEEWFDLARRDHFWFVWRLRAALALARDHGLPLDVELAAFEVGCGAGILRDQLEAATAWRVDGTDLDLEALQRIQPGRGDLFLYDVREKRERFREAYDAIVLFDVLEHVEPTRPFLEAVVHHLKPGGHLLVNVPSLPRLYSRYDVAAGHHRRYATELLRREVQGLPLTVLELRYWGLSLVPLAAARKLWLAVSRASGEGIIERGFEPPGPIVHGALRSLMAVETALMRRPPVGASLLMLARRD